MIDPCNSEALCIAICLKFMYTGSADWQAQQSSRFHGACAELVKLRGITLQLYKRLTVQQGVSCKDTPNL